MRRLEIVLVTFVIAVWAVFAPIYVSFVIALHRELGPQPWPKPPLVALKLPDGKSRLIFNMRHTHPIHPQFDHRITVVLPDGRRLTSESFDELRQPTNIAIYWYPGAPPDGPLLRLQYKSRHVVVHIGKGWIEGMIRFRGKPRMVPPFGSYANDWNFVSKGMIEIVDYASRKVVKRYREREVPRLLKQGKGRFLGRIYGRGIWPEFFDPTRPLIEDTGGYAKGR